VEVGHSDTRSQLGERAGGGGGAGSKRVARRSGARRAFELAVARTDVQKAGGVHARVGRGFAVRQLTTAMGSLLTTA
jgi:hypothetical protein